MRCGKIIFIVIFTIFMSYPSFIHAYINDIWNIIVDAGETVTLSGHQTRMTSIIINGTVEIPEYVGTLTLEAPRIVIGATGIIDG